MLSLIEDFWRFSVGFFASFRFRVTGLSFGDLNFGFEAGLLVLVSFQILTQVVFIDFTNSSKLSSNFISLFLQFAKDLTISSSKELFELLGMNSTEESRISLSSLFSLFFDSFLSIRLISKAAFTYN